jgi:arginine utilization regulatory protein
VRQLKSCIESAVNFTDDDKEIQFHVLPQYLFEINDTPQMKYRQRRIYESEGVTEIGQDDHQNVVQPKVGEGGILESIREQDKKEIVESLRQTKGNLTRAAKLLGISRQTLTYRLKKYKL